MPSTEEFIRFLKRINRCAQRHLQIHLVLDNYSTYKTPAAKRSLFKHCRFHLHLAPTSDSWLNFVEHFFTGVTQKRIRRGVFVSVAELKEAIDEDLDRHNADPKPFMWIKSEEVIVENGNAQQARSNQIREPSVTA
jgi:hypothetical protein